MRTLRRARQALKAAAPLAVAWLLLLVVGLVVADLAGLIDVKVGPR